MKRSEQNSANELGAPGGAASTSQAPPSGYVGRHATWVPCSDALAAIILRLDEAEPPELSE